jgi:hypothetical protein
MRECSSAAAQPRRGKRDDSENESESEGLNYEHNPRENNLEFLEGHHTIWFHTSYLVSHQRF